MKHKHYEFIVAWANGAKIQWKNDLQDWRDIGDPAWINSYEYRIKPEPKPDVIRYSTAFDDYMCPPCKTFYTTHNLKLTFDGETLELKDAKVLK